MGDRTLLLSAGALELLSCLREWSWCKHHTGPELHSEMHCISEEIWNLMIRKHHEEPGAERVCFHHFVQQLKVELLHRLLELHWNVASQQNLDCSG